jgi:hypothetical protein
MQVDLTDRQLGQTIAWGRIGIGTAALLTPKLLGATMFGPASAAPTSQMLARMAGVRDIAVGVATLAAMNGGLSPSLAVGLGAACDAVDSIAGVAGRGLGVRTRALTAMLAVPAAVLGVRAARNLGGTT